MERGLRRNLEKRRRRIDRPIDTRRRSVVRRSRRKGAVSVGEVETVYSTVVGEGRRVRRWGVVVSMAFLFGFCCEEKWLATRSR